MHSLPDLCMLNYNNKMKWTNLCVEKKNSCCLPIPGFTQTILIAHSRHTHRKIISVGIWSKLCWKWTFRFQISQSSGIIHPMGALGAQEARKTAQFFKFASHFCRTSESAWTHQFQVLVRFWELKLEEIALQFECIKTMLFLTENPFLT